MEINAKLNGNTLALLEGDTTIILPEDKLILVLDSSIYTLYTLVITARNGDNVKRFKTSDRHEIDLTDLLAPGVIEIEISNIRKGEPVKSWRIENLFVKEINHKFEIVPEIENIHQQIKDVSGAIKELYSQLKNNNII